MPLRLEYFLVSESAAIDQSTNRVSVFNVLEEISAEKFPAIVNGVVAIGAFDFTEEGQNADYQAVVSVEGDAIDMSQKFPVNFKATKKRQRLLFNLLGVKLTKPGTLVFHLLINGDHKAEHRIDLKERPPLTPAPLQ